MMRHIRPAVSVPLVIGAFLAITVGLLDTAHAVDEAAQLRLTSQAMPGQTYYVNPSGSDANPCTQAAPCRQIRKALTLLKPGDTVLVATGSYLGFDAARINGTASAPITIKAESPLGPRGSNVRIMPTTDRSDNRDTIHIGPGSSYIVLDGLTSFDAVRAAVRIDASSHIAIRNSIFGNNVRWGIFTNHSDYVMLENNECYGSRREHGIYFSNSGDYPSAIGNIIHDNNQAGIHVNGDASQPGDGIISNGLVAKNIIYNNGRGGGAAINMDGTQHTVVSNNILYNNHANGITAYRIDAAGGPKGNQIYNNTIVMSPDARFAVLFGQTSGRNTMQNNILYNLNSRRGGISYISERTDVPNVDSDYNIFGKEAPKIAVDDGSKYYTLSQWQTLKRSELHSAVASTTDLFVEPSADPATADYHLKGGSPAIDAGVALRSVLDDIDGQRRPYGTAYDVGADELTVQPAPGKLAMVGPLAIAPASPAPGQAVEASFSVENVGDQPVSVRYVLVGARDPGGANVDFPTSPPITLRPGERYAYRQPRAFSRLGPHTAWPAYYDGAEWVELGPRTTFTVGARTAAAGSHTGAFHIDRSSPADKLIE